MWKLLRGKAEFNSFVKYVLETDNGLFSAFDVEEPEEYPCLVQVSYLNGMAVGLTYVYVKDATALLKVFENGGIL